jgi:hypothetical protein
MIVSSLMSDTKWRKLVQALDRADLALEQVRVKFVGDKDVHVTHMPKRASLYSPWAWIDMNEFGPVKFREIEWLEFPAIAEFARPSPGGVGRVPSRSIRQDLERIEAVLARVGKFPMERTSDALRIVGHLVRGPLKRSRTVAVDPSRKFGRKKSLKARL